MKLSVIFGVFHMSIGIVMKGTNMYFRKMWLEMFTEVVAGFFILFFLFGWMDVLIISKWFTTPDINDCATLKPVYGNGTDKPATENICVGEWKNR